MDGWDAGASFAFLSNGHDTLWRSLSLASFPVEIYVANEYSNTVFLTILNVPHTLGSTVTDRRMRSRAKADGALSDPPSGSTNTKSRQAWLAHRTDSR